jgi:glycosyltransferase involved in cell wall biosynthesis
MKAGSHWQLRSVRALNGRFTGLTRAGKLETSADIHKVGRTRLDPPIFQRVGRVRLGAPTSPSSAGGLIFLDYYRVGYRLLRDQGHLVPQTALAAIPWISGRIEPSPPYHSKLMPDQKPTLTILGQTPPPWHGQAVATQILFDHDWPDFDGEFVRMDYSEDMDEVGRFQFRKIGRLLRLIIATRRSLSRGPESILLYPPASAKWIPFLRDVFFLACVRGKAAKTVFIFHASGLAAFAKAGSVRSWLAEIAYHGADMALEVAEEAVAPHEVFHAKRHKWCPCGIEVPQLPRERRAPGAPLKVLFVGSLQEGKGVLEILKTAAHLKESGHADRFRFEIVGSWMDEDFNSQAFAMQRELGLEEMILFPGQLTGDDKWEAYRKADVFFFPSHYPSEASPIVLMEALGSGLPVVTTAWNGIPALMKGCPTATLLPVKSPAEYAGALLGHAAKTDTPEEVSRQSREFYRAHFLPERFVERVNRAFHEVAPVQTGKATEEPLRVSVYLADQNPGQDRSLGISRMSKVVLEGMTERDDIRLQVITSRSSQRGPESAAHVQTLPWSTRSRPTRLFTDHLHPLVTKHASETDIWYFPKGFLPAIKPHGKPSVVTVHDTIIQHHADHYPHWRKKPEYAYWSLILRHTLRHADVVLTVSEHSRAMILAFMARHKLPEREITVTYEPCCYEGFEQPHEPPKGDHVLHLASREPHKRSHDLIRWWAARARLDGSLPVLELVGNIPSESWDIVASNSCFRRRPFLDDEELRNTITQARALILPSEIEGFGLPAIEAYYLGTPVCFTKGTSIEEILGQSTSTGGFELDAPESLWPALEEVLAMPAEEIRRIGLELRVRFKAEKIVGRMVEAFRKIATV